MKITKWITGVVVYTGYDSKIMLNSNKISEFKNINLYGLIFNQSADIPDTVRLFDCIAKGMGVKVSIKNGTIKACENAIAIASNAN